MENEKASKIRHCILAVRGRYNPDGTTTQHAELRTQGDRICSGLTSVQKDNLILVKKVPAVRRLSCRIVGRNPKHPTSRKVGLPTMQMVEPRDDPDICGNLTTVQKDTMVLVCRLR